MIKLVQPVNYFILFFVHHIRDLRLNSPRLEKGSFTIKQRQVA